MRCVARPRPRSRPRSRRLRSSRRRGLDPFVFAHSLSSAARRPAERRPPRPLQELCQAPAATSRCPRTVTLLEDPAPGPGRGAERGRSGPFTVVARPATPLALQPDARASRGRCCAPTKGERGTFVIESNRAADPSIPRRPSSLLSSSHLRLRSVPSDSRVASLPPEPDERGRWSDGSPRPHPRGSLRGRE